MYRRQIISACLVVPLFASGLTFSHAQTSNLPLAGTITRISAGSGTIFVDDTPYKIRSSVKMVELNGEPRKKLQKGELSVGTYVEFSANNDEPVKRITVMTLPNF